MADAELLKLKNITLGTFTSSDTEYLTNLIVDELAELGIKTSSFAFSIEVDYLEDKEN